MDSLLFEIVLSLRDEVDNRLFVGGEIADGNDRVGGVAVLVGGGGGAGAGEGGALVGGKAGLGREGGAM